MTRDSRSLIQQLLKGNHFLVVETSIVVISVLLCRGLPSPEQNQAFVRSSTKKNSFSATFDNVVEKKSDDTKIHITVNPNITFSANSEMEYSGVVLKSFSMLYTMVISPTMQVNISGLSKEFSRSKKIFSFPLFTNGIVRVNYDLEAELVIEGEITIQQTVAVAFQKSISEGFKWTSPSNIQKNGDSKTPLKTWIPIPLSPTGIQVQGKISVTLTSTITVQVSPVPKMNVKLQVVFPSFYPLLISKLTFLVWNSNRLEWARRYTTTSSTAAPRYLQF